MTPGEYQAQMNRSMMAALKGESSYRCYLCDEKTNNRIERGASRVPFCGPCVFRFELVARPKPEPKPEPGAMDDLFVGVDPGVSDRSVFFRGVDPTTYSFWKGSAP